MTSTSRSALIRSAFSSLLAVVLVGAAGCGPSLSSSLRGRHYDDAICGAAFAPSAASRVGRALSQDLAAAVHLHAVTPEELERGLAGRIARDPRRLVDELQIVRVVYSANRLPSVHFDLAVGATSDGRPLRVVALGQYEGVLALTHEPPPTPRTRTSDGTGRAVAANILLSPLLLMANLFTIPAGKAVYVKARPYTVTLPLDDDDWARGAPDTFRIRNAFTTAACADAMDRPCEAFFAVEQVSPDSDVTLDFSLRFGPLPLHDDRASGPACLLELHERVELTRGVPIGARIAARFGDRQRTFAELGSIPTAIAELLDGR